MWLRPTAVEPPSSAIPRTMRRVSCCRASLPAAISLPSSFLLVRLGALGDIVHAIPVAAALRRAFPSARIDWLVSAKHREILDLVPVLNRRIVVNDRQGTGKGSGQGLHMLSAVAALRQSRYEIAFDLQGLIKSAIIARATGAGRVVG